MSLGFDAVGDFANRAVGTGLAASWGGWWQRLSQVGDRQICEIETANRGLIFEEFNATNVGVRIIAGAGQLANFAVALNEWIFLAISRNANIINFYKYTEAGVRTDINLNVDIGVDAGTNTVAVRLGNNDGYGDTAFGSNRYWRAWTRALTAADWDAEVTMTPSGGTPAASVTSIWGSYLMPDGTTTTDVSGQSHPLSITSGVTSGGEPSIPGPPAVPQLLVRSQNILLTR